VGCIVSVGVLVAAHIGKIAGRVRTQGFVVAPPHPRQGTRTKHSVISLVVAACLMASPLAGCATARGPRRIDVDVPGAPAGWSRVREVTRAAQIEVTIRGSQPEARYFVMADDSRLVVLNLSNLQIPAASIRALRTIAAQRPEHFAALQPAETIARENVRIGREGLFVADRKIADRDQVVQAISRDVVTEIRGPVVARGSVFGTVIGGFLGFAVGAVPALGGASESAAGLALVGSVLVGSTLGFRSSSHETDGVVYRAP